MVALRKDMVWHFYDSQNKLMFNHEIIAPTAVSSFKLGYSRVRALTAVKENLPAQISYNLVDANGIFLNLAYPKPDSIDWEIHDIFEFEPNKKAIKVYNPNNNTFSFFNDKNKFLPTQPLFYTQYLGEGLIAGFGKMPFIVPNADYSYGDGPENEYGYNYDFTSLNDFEIWSLSSGKKIKTLKVQELGQATNGVIPAKKDELWGLINTKGQWLCLPKFNNIGQATIHDDNLDQSEPNRSIAAGLIPARLTEDENWGLIDQKGNWVVAPDYGSFVHFTPYCWLALTPSLQTITLFDNQGKELKIIAKNDVDTGAARYITSCDNINMNSPILLLKFKGLTSLQLYNTKTNTISYACEKCDFLSLDDSTILIKEGTNQFLIDATGKTIARLLPTTEAKYKAPLTQGIFAFLDHKTQKYGYTDRQGNIVINPNLARPATTVGPDFLYYSEDKYYFFIDHKGNIIHKYFLDDSSDWEILVPLYDKDWSPIER